MKAILQDRYGSIDVFHLGQIDKPAPRDDEVLVRVYAASMHPDIWHTMRGVPYILRLMGAGLLRPKEHVPGTDMAGVVEAVGKDVRQFQPGDEVFGETNRKIQWRNSGAFAEFVAAPAVKLAPKPVSLSFEEAAAIPTSGCIAWLGVHEEGKVKPGQKVLINGAAGGVGMLALQIAKAAQAEVTGVDHTDKMELMRQIGADHVIDYTQEDFTRGVARYDLIVDVPGNHTLRDCRRALTPKGNYVFIGHDQFGAFGSKWVGSIGRFLKMLVYSPFVRQHMGPGFSPGTNERLPALKALVDAGTLTPVIDRTFPLADVPEAMRHLQAGHAVGKIIISI